MTSEDVDAVRARRPTLWLNPERAAQGSARPENELFLQAEDRLLRAGGLLRTLFPELRGSSEGIESPLHPAPRLQEALRLPQCAGKLFIKADHELPVVGSIKARGGFHEVLAHAESLAVGGGLLSRGAELPALGSPEARELFSQRTIAVGSTGNLGLSIGTLAAALGFRAVVHMSSDAKSWKKQELRRRGAEVIEHAGDYASAVAEGRKRSAQDPLSYFVDDENSELLLSGYAAVARPLAEQLAALGRTPSQERPLFVYIPCGVGGAPGGISLGLASLFGRHVHCFFAEPVASPCMLLKMASGPGTDVSVYDYGLDNVTEADGLAVPRASDLIASRVRDVLSGIYTVTDDQLFAGLLRAWEAEGMEIEPSAAAGFHGPKMLLETLQGQRYAREHSLVQYLPDATHLLWTTGGSLVPRADHERFRSRAFDLDSKLDV